MCYVCDVLCDGVVTPNTGEDLEGCECESGRVVTVDRLHSVKGDTPSGE